MTERLTASIAAALNSYGDRPCIEFGGRWYTGKEVAAYGIAITASLREADVADDAPVGLIVRNRLHHAAAIAGFLAAGRTVAMIYSFQSPEGIARDVEQLNLSAVVADSEDWTPPVVSATRRVGGAGIAISLTEPIVDRVPGLELCDSTKRHAPAEPGVALKILTLSLIHI